MDQEWFLHFADAALLGECPTLGFVDIGYGVFLVPPSKWDDKVILSWGGYLTRYVGAVAIFSDFEEDRMCEVLFSR